MDIEQHFKQWWATVPRCIGYEGGCDGDLEGIGHLANCPINTRGRAMDVTYRDAFEAGFKAGVSFAQGVYGGENEANDDATK